MGIRTLKDTGADYTISSNVDGAVYSLATSDCVIGGMGDEFAITTSASSLMVSFAKGSQAVLCGNAFWLTGDESVELPSDSTFFLCARIDTSMPNGKTGTFACLTESAIKKENINESGVRDLKLYKITTSSNGVTSCEDVRVINTASDYATQTYVDDAIETIKPITKTNISVSVTPTQLSTYMNWDTENKYGYSATVTVEGITANSMIQNIVMTDTLMDSIAPIITTGANSLTFYTENSTKLTGTIFTLITVEIA